MDGSYDIAAQTQIDSSTVIFDADATITDLGSDLELSSADLSIASGQSFSFATVGIYFSSLTGGGGTLTVTGSMTWNGGTISGFSSLIIPSGASLALGYYRAGYIDTLQGVPLQNDGTTTLGGVYGQGR